MESKDNKLQIIIRDSGLETTKAKVLLENFKDYFDIAAEWEIKAKSLLVTKESQVANIKMARIGRLFLREKRIAIENTRKKLKEQALREGKAIDGIANVLKAVIVPIEEYLNKQEKFVEIRDAEIAEQRRIEADRLLREKEEAERIAREKAEVEERELIRIENERLKAEAVERERLAEIRQREQEKLLAEQQKKAETERKALEEKARVEREKQERILAKEREQVEIERKKQEALLAKQKAEAEIKQKAIEEKNRQEQIEASKKQIERDRLAEIERRKQVEILKIEKEKQDKLKAEIEKLNNQIECPKCHFKFTIVKKFTNELTLL